MGHASLDPQAFMKDRLLAVLLRRQRFDQHYIYNEVLVCEEALRRCLSAYFAEKPPPNVCFEQLRAAVRETRLVPNILIRAQPDEPPEQQVVVGLLERQLFAADGVQDLQQQARTSFPGGIDGHPPDLPADRCS